MSRLKIKSIAVDYDNTLIFSDPDLYPYYEPKDVNRQAFSVLKEYKKRGGIILLFSCRTDEHLQIAIDACKKYGLEFDAINSDTSKAIKDWREKFPRSSISPKPYVELFIDDRAWPCHKRGLDWTCIAHDILEEEEDG